MHQIASITKFKHKIFVERVVEFEIVWGLESADGFATSCSNEDDDLAVIVFWSDKAYAKALAKSDWAEYQPTSMNLSEFLENWLVGMHNDKILAGTNWDPNMFGSESEPLELAIEIIEELKLKNKSVHFEKYVSLTDFEKQIRLAVSAN